MAIKSRQDHRGSETTSRAWVDRCSTRDQARNRAIAFTEAIQRLPEHQDCSLVSLIPSLQLLTICLRVQIGLISMSDGVDIGFGHRLTQATASSIDGNSQSQ